MVKPEVFHAKKIEIEVIFVAADQSGFHRAFTVKEGTTVAEAIEQSGVLKMYPEVLLYPKGIFSQVIADDRILESGDRIECYRPLIIDPKVQRRLRSKKL